MPTDVIMHCHIFKNAGTSFDAELSRVFGDSFEDNRQDEYVVSNPRAPYDIVKDRNLSAISSHSFYWQPRDTGDVRFHRALFFRHPLRRAWSAYIFQRQQQVTTPAAQAAKKLPFREFTAWKLDEDNPAMEFNLQSKFLFGRGRGYKVTPDDEPAIHELLEREPMIGVVELYPESLVVFNDYLKNFFEDVWLSQQRKNESVAADANRTIPDLQADLGSCLLNKFQERNGCDYTLWQSARSLLLKRLRAVSDYPLRLSEVISGTGR